MGEDLMTQRCFPERRHRLFCLRLPSARLFTLNLEAKLSELCICSEQMAGVKEVRITARLASSMGVDTAQWLRMDTAGNTSFHQHQ